MIYLIATVHSQVAFMIMDTLGPSNESLSNLKRVLVILPSSHIQSILENYNTQRKFEFHWLTDPNAPDLFGSNIAATKTPTKFNALSFVSSSRIRTKSQN